MRCDKPQKVPLHPRGAPYPSICWWDLLAVLSQSPYGALDSECRREVSFDTKRCATAGVAAPPSTISPFLMGLPYSALLPLSTGFNIAPLRSSRRTIPWCVRKGEFCIGITVGGLSASPGGRSIQADRESAGKQLRAVLLVQR